MGKKCCTVGELIDLLKEVDPSSVIECWFISVYGKFESTNKIFWTSHRDGTSTMRCMDCRVKAIHKCSSILCPNAFINSRTIFCSIRDAVHDKSHRKALKKAARKPLKQWDITDLMLLSGVGVKTAGKMLIKIHSQKG